MLSALALTVVLVQAAVAALLGGPAKLQDGPESGTAKAAVEAVEGESPSALPAATASGSTSARLLPPTEPPPKLWARSPREAGFARFDEQMRYERCMQQRGWSRTRS